MKLDLNALREISRQKALTGASIQAGRQLKTADVLGVELHIIRAANVASKDGTFAAVRFREHESCYYNTGKLLTENIRAWAEAAGDAPDAVGEYTNLNTLLEEEGGIGVILVQKKSDKNGAEYVLPMFIE